MPPKIFQQYSRKEYGHSQSAYSKKPAVTPVKLIVSIIFLCTTGNGGAKPVGKSGKQQKVWIKKRHHDVIYTAVPLFFIFND